MRLALRALAALLIAGGLAVLLAAVAELASPSLLGRFGVPMIAAAGALGLLAAAPAFLRRPLVPLLVTTTPLLVVALARHGTVAWWHLLWGDASPAPVLGALGALAAGAVPAGVLLAHAAATDARAWRLAVLGGAATAAVAYAAPLVPALPYPLLAAGAGVVLLAAAAWLAAGRQRKRWSRFDFATSPAMRPRSMTRIAGNSSRSR